MERTFDNVKITSSFEVPETRNNLVSGETIGKHFGNIAKNIEVLGEHIGNQTIHAKVWKGTQEEYNAIESKEDDTIYIIKDSDNTLADKLIDDSSTTATDKTWSVKKINESIPTSLPANGGNADTLGDIPASELNRLRHTVIGGADGNNTQWTGIDATKGDTTIRMQVDADYDKIFLFKSTDGQETWTEIELNADTIGGKHADEIANNSNLLINPDFRINQRGQNEYSSGYTVDGWYIEGTKCSVRPSVDGILITSAIKPDSNTHAFWQKFENPFAPGNYTLSLNVLEVSGNWSARVRTVDSSGVYKNSYYTEVLQAGINKVSVNLPKDEYISHVSIGILVGTEVADTLKVEWIKLETGETATVFMPPNPATELLKCQRYFTIYKHQNATSSTDKCTIGVGYALTSSIIYAVLPIAAMRSGVAATVSYSGLSLINGTDTVVDFSSATALEQTDSTMQVAFTVSGQTPGAVYRLRLMNSDAYLAVSKEL